MRTWPSSGKHTQTMAAENHRQSKLTTAHQGRQRHHRFCCVCRLHDTPFSARLGASGVPLIVDGANTGYENTTWSNSTAGQSGPPSHSTRGVAIARSSSIWHKKKTATCAQQASTALPTSPAHPAATQRNRCRQQGIAMEGPPPCHRQYQAAPSNIAQRATLHDCTNVIGRCTRDTTAKPK